MTKQICQTKKKNFPLKLLGAFFTEYIPKCFQNDSVSTTREWTFDSVSTSHICQNKKFFINMSPPIRESVIKIRSIPHRVEGINKAVFTLKNGLKIKTIILENVFYVLSIYRNLISMGHGSHGQHKYACKTRQKVLTHFLHDGNIFGQHIAGITLM